MDAARIRDEFRRFAGEDRYRKFVRAVNTAPFTLTRLRFWQQALWDSFVNALTGCPRDFGEVRETFRVCEIHDVKLIADRVLAPYSQIQWCDTQSPDSGLHRGTIDNDNYPYSGWGVCPDAWPPEDNRFVEILYCPECRKRRADRERTVGP